MIKSFMLDMTNMKNTMMVFVLSVEKEAKETFLADVDLRLTHISTTITGHKENMIHGNL